MADVRRRSAETVVLVLAVRALGFTALVTGELDNGTLTPFCKV